MLEASPKNYIKKSIQNPILKSVQCNELQCSSEQFGAAQFSSLECIELQCISVYCSAFQFSAVQCSPVQYWLLMQCLREASGRLWVRWVRVVKGSFKVLVVGFHSILYHLKMPLSLKELKINQASYIRHKDLQTSDFIILRNAHGKKRCRARVTIVGLASGQKTKKKLLKTKHQYPFVYIMNFTIFLSILGQFSCFAAYFLIFKKKIRE